MARERSTTGTGPRRRVAKPRLRIATGAYLTDGARLVQVSRVDGESVVVEEGDTDNPKVATIEASTLAAGGWRNVRLTPFVESEDPWWREWSGRT